MKALLLLGALLATAPAVDPLFAPAEIRDRTSLELKISQPSDYTSSLMPERKLKRIDLTFTSFEWAGEKWRHPCFVLMPDRAVPEYRGAAAIVAANGAGEFATESAEVAALMGIPALAIVGANPGPHYGVKGEGAVMARMEEKFMQTGDPHWIGYAALGKVILRAITAMQAVPGVRAERFVVTGSSKRGMATWIAAGADDRIVGAFPVAWNMANFEAALRLQAERLGTDYDRGGDGPAAKSPGSRLAALATPRGKEYQRYLDPFLWRDRIANKPILFTVGANDPLFPPLSDTVFLPDMPKSTRILLVPNHRHGHEKERQTVGWRMWLAHVFGNRPVPNIALTWKRVEGAIQLSAAVTSANPVKAVTAWSATDERGVYLDCKWQPTALVGSKGVYRAEVAAPIGRHTAFWVEVEDEDVQSGRGLISTGMQEIK